MQRKSAYTSFERVPTFIVYLEFRPPISVESLKGFVNQERDVGGGCAAVDFDSLGQTSSESNFSGPYNKSRPWNQHPASLVQDKRTHHFTNITNQVPKSVL